jgi:hypothetical protein
MTSSGLLNKSSLWKLLKYVLVQKRLNAFEKDSTTEVTIEAALVISATGKLENKFRLLD